MAEAVRPAPTAVRTSGRVVAGLTARRAARSGALWGLVFGGYVAVAALSYLSAYKTARSRERLEVAFGNSSATSALFGPAHRLQTVAGFTVFKVQMACMLLGAVWGLATSTRLVRGEEDAGRWELLLSGGTTRARAAAQAVCGLAAGVGALWAVTALLVVVTGRSHRVRFDAGASMYLALALVATAVMFAALGAFCSQLAQTRRQAVGYGAAVLGVAYAVRLVADSGIGLTWLRWASPLGWVEELSPFSSPRPWALLPIAAFTAAATTAAVVLAGHRDLGAGAMARRAVPRPHTGLLSGPSGLALRVSWPSFVGWGAALAATGLLLGLIARSAGRTIAGSSVRQVLSRLGAPGVGADAYLGIGFLILAVLLGFMAAGQATAARSEESSGHLELLVVRPVSRQRWFVGRLALAAVALVVAGVLAGAFTWLGAAAEHAGVGFPTLLGAGLNAVAPAVLVLGAGGLALGLLPRATTAVTYAVLGWSLLVVLAGGFTTLDHWVLDTSVFHQMAAAPAVAADWKTAAVMAGAGVVAAGAGVLTFTRRDLLGE
ncbi:MAG: ABC transporter permease subunit [Acidimicrobiales bacterium]